MQFDSNGYLMPYTGREVNLEAIEQHLLFSEKRKWLFDNYLRYLYQFQEEVFPFFEQWINGSFVSLHPEPNDIDIVTFLDVDVFEKRSDFLLEKFMSFNWETECVDAYVVVNYPIEHPKALQTRLFKERWTRRFIRKVDEQDRNYEKGFLKLIFEP